MAFSVSSDLRCGKKTHSVRGFRPPENTCSQMQNTVKKAQFSPQQFREGGAVLPHNDTGSIPACHIYVHTHQEYQLSTAHFEL